RRHRRGLRKIRDLDREEHVRPQIHGNRPQHLPDRQGRHPARHLAQGEGRRPCRRGAEGGEGALTATLSDSAAAILNAADPAEKVRLSRALAARWRAGGMAVGAAIPPARPGRPMRPRLLPPKEMPRRRNFGSLGGRLALLHALAHIELNAIDLGWDIVARFPRLPREFYDDWVAVAAEEAEHFALLEARLVALDGAYGDLPAHDGLWESAAATAHDLLARLAVVPLVLEARGLDVTPEMIRRLERAGDADSAAILRRLYADETRHVAAGARWFAALCDGDPAAVFHDRVRRYFTGHIKPPFNREARDRAGFPAAYYEGLAGGPTS